MPEPDEQDILTTTVGDGVATLVLNRPTARNALSSALLRALRDALTRFDADPAVDVMILTGADPAFSAGFDLKELSPTNERSSQAPREGSRGPFPRPTKPLIGAINGTAVAGGFELALACDFLVASDRARFADTHARLGLHPGWGLTVRLPKAVGIRRSRELSVTGRVIDAPTALEWGLVNHVVPHDELIPFCVELAQQIRRNDQAAVQAVLATYDANATAEDDQAWMVEGEAVRRSLTNRKAGPS